MNTTNNKLVTSFDKLTTLTDLLKSKQASLAGVLPQHMKPERIVRMALVAASRNPLLLQCEPKSILRAMMDASSTGLEPFSPLGHAYIVPYKNNQTGNMEAQFQAGYKGLVDLARRSGEIVSISANVVREGDLWEYEEGYNQKLKHVPNWAKRGDITLVYAYAILKDGGRQSAVMSRDDVDRIKAKAKAKFGPWVDFYEEMAKKTVLKRLCKLLPASTELTKALDADNAAENGVQFVDVDNITEQQIIDSAAPTAEELADIESKMDSIAGKIGG